MIECSLLKEHEDKQKLQVRVRVHSQLVMTRESFHSFSKTLALKVQPEELTV